MKKINHHLITLTYAKKEKNSYLKEIIYIDWVTLKNYTKAKIFNNLINV